MFTSNIGAAIKGRIGQAIMFLLVLLALVFGAIAPVAFPNAHGTAGVSIAHADDECPYGPAPKPDPNTPCNEPTATPTATPVGQ